ncbi:MAG: L-serine ammonia-lyase [Nannocystaceae bacterium]|nr:L-serine ammonia-lyase [bacterium]
MALSVFDMFSVGIGPSSSHTVGPMRAALRFVERLTASGTLLRTEALKVELFGSLGATGRGHGTGPAVILGLAGERPETVDTDRVAARIEAVEREGTLEVAGRTVRFELRPSLVYHRRKSLPGHPNGMRFTALSEDGSVIDEAVYYSVGGGFVVDDTTAQLVEDSTPLPFAFSSGDELVERCREHGLSISTLMLRNEESWRPAADIRAGLLEIWACMRACVERGCSREGILPGGLKVPRRAAAMHRKLLARSKHRDPMVSLDWVNMWAIAVNEENAAGGRVVTAPTNGAAGVIPAVLHYYRHFHNEHDDDAIIRFLLTAGAIGIIYKTRASISGAEVGCQGEVGVACSMAAAGLAEVMGGSPAQVEDAAEIGMEHNLGLTCDPVGGLVQVPCIERNAMGAVKAINAARLALSGDGAGKVSLDRVIETMRQTGKDMKTKYKETSRGGLAVNIIEC